MKKLAVNKIEAIYNSMDTMNFTIPFNVDEDVIEVEVKRILTLKEMLSIVNSVVDSVTIGADGSYRPELLDYFIRYEVVNTYTNFKLPENIEKCYQILYGTPIFEILTKATLEEGDEIEFNGVVYDKMLIHPTQYHSMIQAIYQKIGFNSSIIYKKSKADMLIDVVTDFVKNANTDFSNIDIKSVLNKVSKMEKIDTKVLADAVIKKQDEAQESNKVVDFPTTGGDK